MRAMRVIARTWTSSRAPAGVPSRPILRMSAVDSGVRAPDRRGVPPVPAEVTEVPVAKPQPPRALRGRSALPVAPRAVAAVLGLQRSAGNRATAAALAAVGRP